MSEDINQRKWKVLLAAEKAVDELINVLNDPIIGNSDEGDISADKMKNAAAAKRLAFEDALFMLERIDLERLKMSEVAEKIITTGNKGFVEGRAKGNGRKS